MLSFLLFLTLFGSYSSQPNYCGWAVINNELQPLRYCQRERGPDSSITSYSIECKQNNDQIIIKWWRNSHECNDSIAASVITNQLPSNFNCNDTECVTPSYLTYKTYLNNDCLSTGTILSNNDKIITDAAIIHNNNNNNAAYRDTTLITNKCYNSTTSPYHQRITCNNRSYSIHSYLDPLCTHLLSTEVIPSTNCKYISLCITPSNTEQPDAIQTTSYFTTTNMVTIAAKKPCNFINNYGYDIPTEKCLILSSTESQTYECNEYGLIEYSYYQESIDCTGNNSFTFAYPLSGIIDYNCDAKTCSDHQYMQLIIFKAEDDCSIDSVSETDYDSHLYLINACMETQDGGGVIYECRNNNNFGGLSGGYSVTTFLDSDCLTKYGDIKIYNEIECIQHSQTQTHHRQHMVFCNGTNDIIIEENPHEEYVIDCNYFVNDNIDPLGVVGEPLDTCMSIKHGALLYSKKYQCNSHKSGIEEVVYVGEDCMDEHIKFTVDRPDFTDFYCGSQYSCDSMVGSYDSVLIGKQYTNDTCSETIGNFWYYQHIIIDQCWPIANGLYAIISCDENGFVYHSLYNDKQCTSFAFNPQRFNSFDCIFGKLFETVHCPHWKHTNKTTQEPVMTSTSISKTSNSDNSYETTESVEPSNTIFMPSDIETTPIHETAEGERGGGGGGVVEDMKKDREECINMFGGKDIGGLSCKHWASIIWALFVLVAGIISCFIFWCWCSNDTKSIRKQNSFLLKRNGSRLSVANGNNNDDLQQIVIQQLTKGQHVNANKKRYNNGQVQHVNVIQEVEDEDNDEKYDEPPFSL